MAYFATLMLLLNGNWVLASGSDGGAAFSFFLAIVYAMVLFRGPLRVALLVFVVANGLVLLGIEYRYPASVVPLKSPVSRLEHMGVSFGMSVMACALMLWAVMRTYDSERRREKRLNHELSEAIEQNRRHAEELEHHLAEIRRLRGLLPICARCKKIRDDAGLWIQAERYISEHSEATFTHGLCPDCARLYMEQDEALGPEPESAGATAADRTTKG